MSRIKYRNLYRNRKASKKHNNHARFRTTEFTQFRRRLDDFLGEVATTTFVGGGDRGGHQFPEIRYHGKSEWNSYQGEEDAEDATRMSLRSHVSIPCQIMGTTTTTIMHCGIITSHKHITVTTASVKYRQTDKPTRLGQVNLLTYS